MLVRFQDVGFLYAGRPEVLNRLNLSVESGEMLAIVGRSGAGKTTVLKLVNRLLLPTSGAVIVEGRDTREWDGIRLRRRIGYVFQDVGLFPHMTIEEKLDALARCGLKLRDQFGVPDLVQSWGREALDEAHLGLVGLDGAHHSGGVVNLK